MRFRTLAAVALCVAAAAVSAGACGGIDPGNVSPSKNTDTMTWVVKNTCRNQVDLRFFDRTSAPPRPIWPSSTNSYLLDAGDKETYKLNCNSKATICMGASLKVNRAFYWGVALDNSQTPGSGDCAVCNGDDPTPIELSGNC